MSHSNTEQYNRYCNCYYKSWYCSHWSSISSSSVTLQYNADLCLLNRLLPASNHCIVYHGIVRVRTKATELSLGNQYIYLVNFTSHFCSILLIHRTRFLRTWKVYLPLPRANLPISTTWFLCMKGTLWHKIFYGCFHCILKKKHTQFFIHVNICRHIIK